MNSEVGGKWGSVREQTNAVEQLLMGHSADVNCICWIPNLEEGYVSSLTRRQTELISCSCDGRIVDWMWCDVCKSIMLVL